jgi:hypothetical protein
MRLPAEILVIVAEHLAGGSSLETLAALNVASRHVHEETRSALYATRMIKYEEDWEEAVLSKSDQDSSSWKLVRQVPTYYHIDYDADRSLSLRRFLVVEDEPPHHPSMLAIDDLLGSLPQLRIIVFKEVKISVSARKFRRIPCHIVVSRAVRLSTILMCLMSSQGAKHCFLISKRPHRSFHLPSVKPRHGYVQETIASITIRPPGRVLSELDASLQLETSRLWSSILAKDLEIHLLDPSSTAVPELDADRRKDFMEFFDRMCLPLALDECFLAGRRLGLHCERGFLP